MIQVENAQRFKNGVFEGYKCTCCGRNVTLNNSVSSRGWNLVCMSCYAKIQRITGMNNKLIGMIHEVGNNMERDHENQHDTRGRRET